MNKLCKHCLQVVEPVDSLMPNGKAKGEREDFSKSFQHFPICKSKISLM